MEEPRSSAHICLPVMKGANGAEGAGGAVINWRVEQTELSLSLAVLGGLGANDLTELPLAALEGTDGASVGSVGRSRLRKLRLSWQSWEEQTQTELAVAELGGADDLTEFVLAACGPARV